MCHNHLQTAQIKNHFYSKPVNTFVCGFRFDSIRFDSSELPQYRLKFNESAVNNRYARAAHMPTTTTTTMPAKYQQLTADHPQRRRRQLIQLCSFLAILANCLIRSACPSVYVPAQRTCSAFWGSPYFARTLATVAEGAFYYQTTRTLGIAHMWNDAGGKLFWLWVFGEALSWVGLVFQSSIANALEDAVWCVWFAVAFGSSASPSRHVLLPLIVYYLTVHLPSLVPTLQWAPSSRVTGDGDDDDGNSNDIPLVRTLDPSGDWVVPSVVAKLGVYMLFAALDTTATATTTATTIDPVEPVATPAVAPDLPGDGVVVVVAVVSPSVIQTDCPPRAVAPLQPTPSKSSPNCSTGRVIALPR
jgi:hypothetical protein